MSPEITELAIETSLQQRVLKIPKYTFEFLIRKKNNNQLSEIINFEQPPVNQARSAGERLEDELKSQARTLLISKNGLEQAQATLALVWILYGNHEISDEQKISDIYQIYEIWSAHEVDILENAVSIVARVTRMTKEASNP